MGSEMCIRDRALALKEGVLMWKKTILAVALIACGVVGGFAAYDGGDNPPQDENVQLCPIGENGERGVCGVPERSGDDREACRGPHCNR